MLKFPYEFNQFDDWVYIICLSTPSHQKGHRCLSPKLHDNWKRLVKVICDKTLKIQPSKFQLKNNFRVGTITRWPVSSTAKDLCPEQWCSWEAGIYENGCKRRQNYAKQVLEHNAIIIRDSRWLSALYCSYDA